MDATWGRGNTYYITHLLTEIRTLSLVYWRNILFATAKYRTEVWNDDVNPINDWWDAYSASEEEIEAMAAGYDFNNPEEYFKSKGAHLLTHSLTRSLTHSLTHSLTYSHSLTHLLTYLLTYLLIKALIMQKLGKSTKALLM